MHTQTHFVALFTARLDEIDNQWSNLTDLSNLRKQRLNEAVDFYQFFADADDVDHWMVDTLRIVSSDDVGRDEANAQSLLKKHKVDYHSVLCELACTI